MGMMGRYIDGLTAEQKDRIIEAQSWGTGPMGPCIMAHAYRLYEPPRRQHYIESYSPLRRFAREAGLIYVGVQHDSLFGRFKQRYVNAIKKRAGKPQVVIHCMAVDTMGAGAV